MDQNYECKCFLCNSKYCVEEEEDWKNQKWGNGRTRLSKFQKALGLILKLNVERNGNGDEKNDKTQKHLKTKIDLIDDGSVGLSCCDFCSQALLELLRFQETIEESGRKQGEILESLKDVLERQSDVEVCSEVGSENGSEALLDPTPVSLLKAVEEELANAQDNCEWIFQERYEDIALLRELESPVFDYFNFDCCIHESLPKEKAQTHETSSQTENNDASAHANKIQVQERGVTLTMSSVESNESCKYKFESNSIEIPLQKAIFYKINEEILVLLRTPIKISPVELTCLERGCSHSVEGSDYFAFQKIKVHVVRSHIKDYGSAIKKVERNCPICSWTCNTGKELRCHLLNEHSQEGSNCKTLHRTIICESCLMPLPYQQYLVHVWRHKNEKEIEEAIAAGEIIPQKASTIFAVKQTLKKLDEKHKTKIQPDEVNKDALEGCAAVASSSTESSKVTKKRKSDRTDKGFGKQGSVGNKVKYEDEYCSLFFQMTENLLYHDGVLISVSTNEFRCKEGNCGMKVAGMNIDSFEALRKHVKYAHRWAMNIMHPSTQRLCPLCSQEFNDIVQFKDHILKLHSPLAVCKYCWRKFQDCKELASHMLTHMSEKERKIAQTQCNKKTRYCYVNERIKNHVCQVCQKRFESITNLKAHQVVHVPKHLREHFKCSECDNEFLSKVALRSHVEKQHRPDLATKKRECNVCGKQFHHRDGERYRTHVRSHTGETPWICDLCGKGFKFNESFKEHRKLHFDGCHYLCQCCGKRYKTAKKLTSHTRTSHKDFYLAQLERNRQI